MEPLLQERYINLPLQGLGPLGFKRQSRCWILLHASGLEDVNLTLASSALRGCKVQSQVHES